MHTLYWRGKLKSGARLALNNGNRTLKAKRKRQWDKDIVDKVKHLRQTYPNQGRR
ncbi:MAG: hypothetical protein PSN35_06135 [Candidatus Thioglobus sp.]|uniref:hypothetical protein n=1 Tax=Candidatus Thioglobus sp. TaxID=2026721 RepID=UPI002616EBB0|nr:hypothetical protein [Candidatus Thioglobus sp.]MDC9727394.1 hypothetical protein [Candidatus Thioglobus sp.]